MIKRKLSKYLMSIGAMILVLAIVVPAVAAYEGNLIDIRAHVKGKIECRATRTQGFWKNHVDAAEFVLTNYLGGNINLGWPEPCTDITNIGDLLGIFWASKSEDSHGNKRDDVDPTGLCKSKEKAAIQVLAAILNSACPNGAPMPLSLEDIQEIMSGDNKTAIDALQALMDGFNNSGEGYPLGIDEGKGETDEKARDMANIPFADCNNNDQCLP